MQASGAVVLFLLGLLCVPGTALAKDITGYKSGSSVWTLGAAKGSVSLKGFSLQEGYDLPKECQSYFDGERTLQFRGVDKQAAVTLLFWDGRLCGIVLGIDRAQMPFMALYDYYGERYGGNFVPMEDKSTFKIWRDRDNDFLTIVSDQYATPDEPQAWTNVYYLTEEALHNLGPALPVLTGLDDWLVGKMEEHAN